MTSGFYIWQVRGELGRTIFGPEKCLKVEVSS